MGRGRAPTSGTTDGLELPCLIEILLLVPESIYIVFGQIILHTGELLGKKHIALFGLIIPRMTNRTIV